MSWDDLHAFIYAAPPGTALFHAIEKGWTTTDYLLAIIGDAVQDLVWQNTEDGHNDRRRPKRIPRPQRGDEEGTAPTGFGGRATLMSVDEFEARRAERARKWVEKHGPKRRHA